MKIEIDIPYPRFKVNDIFYLQNIYNKYVGT